MQVIIINNIIHILPSACLFFYKGCNLPCFFYVRHRKDAVWIRDKHLNFIKTGEWGKDAVYYYI